MDIKQILEILIIVLVVLLGGIYVYWQIKKVGLRKFVIDMIVKAEETYSKGQNEAKMNFVIDKVIGLLPVPLRFFITRDCVKRFIQIIFDEIKKALDYKSKK